MARCTIVIPTRDRHDELARTMGMVGALSAHDVRRAGGIEAVVVDNASHTPASVETRLDNGVRTQLIRLEENIGTAARNIGARHGAGDWLLMLDDDSAPLGAGFVDASLDAPDDVDAIGGAITLPDGSRERGGLPEVIVGCGALVRRERFLALGGYDEDFGYYAEEYDLCAKILLAGGRVGYDERLRVEHRKVTHGRDMNAILRRITRNSAWVELRYAPDEERDGAVEAILERYASIAEREGAVEGYEQGVAELASTYEQRRRPMTRELYDRFTGLTHARRAIERRRSELEGRRVALVGAGKQAWVIETALAELGLTGRGCDIVERAERAEAWVVGTLSPGPMFDARQAWDARRDGRPLVMPWLVGPAPSSIASAA